MSVETYTTAKIKVGFFSILSLAIFVGFLFWVSGGRNQGLFAAPRQVVVVPFEDITGLRTNANVTIAGQVVGEVVERRLDGKLAVVTMEIDRDVRLYENARFAVVTPSLFGGAEIAVDPGGIESEESLVRIMETEEVIVSGERRQVVRFSLANSASTVGIADLTARGVDTVQVVNDILTSFQSDQLLLQQQLNRVMTSTANLLDKLDGSVREEQIRATADNVQALTEQLQVLVSENREVLAALTHNLNETVQTAQRHLDMRGEEVGTLLQTMNRSIDEHVAPLLTQMERLTTSLERIAGDNEPVLYDTMLSVRAAVANLEAFTARIRANPALLIFGSSEEAAQQGAARLRFDRDLRDRGRLPLYDKRER